MRYLKYWSAFSVIEPWLWYDQNLTWNLKFVLQFLNFAWNFWDDFLLWLKGRGGGEEGGFISKKLAEEVSIKSSIHYVLRDDRVACSGKKEDMHYTILCITYPFVTKDTGHMIRIVSILKKDDAITQKYQSNHLHAFEEFKFLDTNRFQ